MVLKSVVKLGFGILLAALLLLYPLSHEITPSDLQLAVPHLFYIKQFETEYLYIIHHIIVFIPVFIFAGILDVFAYQYHFIKDWLLSVITAAFCFIIWDYAFTEVGIWGFNPKYVSGFSIGGFPIEEIIWFLVVPYASLYIFHLVDRFGSNLREKRSSNLLIVVVIVVLTLFYFKFDDKLYSCFTSGVGIALCCLAMIRKTSKHEVLIVSFPIIIIPMILVDGLLTGMFTSQPLVAYNPQEFSQIRLISIPVEDFIFGWDYLLSIILIKDIVSNSKSEH
ncbi:MAG TPA: lycopene cyclase domain-containing protein [Saprospiraceae bacterium]|nr:lycopene cyclase domain-containing protein [Saprospiraceae bacterium]